jgi:hypothetical protein
MKQGDLFNEWIFEGYDSKTVDAFRKAHEQRPEIYKAFVKYALEMKQKRNHYSQRTIVEVVRWHRDLEYPGEEFKINNNWIALYARLAIKDYPELEHFFELRRIRGLAHPEFEKDQLDTWH